MIMSVSITTTAAITTTRTMIIVIVVPSVETYKKFDKINSILFYNSNGMVQWNPSWPPSDDQVII